MENQKVYFPCYGGCEFGSLQKAVNYVQQMRGGLYVYIVDIVFYNVRFRDCLREKREHKSAGLFCGRTEMGSAYWRRNLP